MLSRLRQRVRRWRRTRRDGKIVQVRGPRGLTFRWIVDHRYPQEMVDGTYEAELVEAILDVLEPGDGFLDVGANAGYVSLCVRLALGEGTVVAFEPLPANVRMIERVLAANPGQRFEVVAAAVAESDGTVRLEVPRNRANAHLEGVRWELTKPSFETIEIPAVGLRGYLDRIRPKVVKIDVEGAEHRILAALGEPDGWSVKPIFFVELHGEVNAQACPELFRGWGYELFHLDGTAIRPQEVPSYWSRNALEEPAPLPFVVARPERLTPSRAASAP